MSAVSYVIEFTINHGELDKFKNLAGHYTALTKENEPGTLAYEWYLQESGNRCLIRVSFTDSDALLTHFGNVGPTIPELLAIAPITRFEVLGPLSDDARVALDSLYADHFPLMVGFTR